MREFPSPSEPAGSVRRRPWPSRSARTSRISIAPRTPRRPTASSALRSWSENELAAREDELIVRKGCGFIRECHGDMHLGNMILADGAVTIFDCIEFNPDLRWIDVMSEVAFCTMDLEDRGRVDLARRYLNAYLEWSGDYAGLAVFPLYFTYRALVRAKVAQLRREQEGLSQTEGERLARELANYLQLAEKSTVKQVPFLAITHGLSGSGKTFGSQAVVERLGAIRLRSDIERKRLAGLGPLAETQSGVGSGLYRVAFSRRTFDKLAELAGTIVKAGFPAARRCHVFKAGRAEPVPGDCRDLEGAVFDSRFPGRRGDVPGADSPAESGPGRRLRSDRGRACDHQLRIREMLEADEEPFVVLACGDRPGGRPTESGPDRTAPRRISFGQGVLRRTTGLGALSVLT